MPRPRAPSMPRRPGPRSPLRHCPPVTSRAAANLADTGQAASVGVNLRALKSAASAVRERLSQGQWHVIVRSEADFFQRCAVFSADGQTPGRGEQHQSQYLQEYSSVEALRALELASGFLSAITGAQTDRMTRDNGWRLLSVGRLIERLNTLAGALVRGFETGSVFEEGGFNAMVALFDSTITFCLYFSHAAPGSQSLRA